MPHQYQDLITLFNNTFADSHNTILVKGGDEPLYSPANAPCQYHQIIFAHGYYASALHEISHWCQAGAARRKLEDFGYWYMPDGRNEQQQKAFEQVEIKPQAIEWAFCLAAKKVFNISADNLNGYQADDKKFESAVLKQVQQYLTTGFPPQAAQFIQVLADFYQVNYPLTTEQFSVSNSANTEAQYVYV